MTRQEYNEKFPEGDNVFKGMNRDNVWDRYHTMIRPFLPVISAHLTEDEPTPLFIITKGLKVSTKFFNVCREIFEDLQEVLDNKINFAQFTADVLIQEGVEKTEGKNPRMIELYQKRFNPKYGEKAELEVTLPTMEVIFTDAKMEEEELSQLFGEEEE
jgi:hypothetical protein